MTGRGSTSSPGVRPPSHRVPDPRRTLRESDAGVYDHLAPLLVEFARPDTGSARRRALREELVVGYLPVVRNIARRYRDRGESVEDLEQVGVLGLLHALERFEPARGPDFLAYLIPTVTGEVRRHFRDRAWSMRVPRRLKDLQQPVRQTVDVLSARLRRAPRPSEIAAHLDVSVADVIDALQARNAYAPEPLDAVTGDGPSPAVLGRIDREMDVVDHRDALRAALDELPDRERTIVVLRFFGELTQTQIAREVGVSQMHVSRLLTQSLATLRSVVDAD